MAKLRVLWFDLTVGLKEGELPPCFRKHCEVVHASSIEGRESALATQDVDALCFDFDYPQRAGLRLLRETKAAHPSLPVVMLTVQHSEALAIWAFRAKVLDYLVKPISNHDGERSIAALSCARGLAVSQPARHATSQPNKIPEEVSYAPRADVAALSPALLYAEKYFRSKVRGEDVAAQCGLSPFRFSRAFKEAYGITFRDYLVDFRLKEACRLLENPTATVTDVAFAVGFNDASYFTRMFKQRIGTMPSLVIGRALDKTALPALPASTKAIS